MREFVPPHSVRGFGPFARFLLLAWLAACGGESSSPEPLVDRTVYLLNLPPEQVEVGDAEGVDLRRRPPATARVRRRTLDGRARRSLEHDTNTDVCFRSVLRPEATLSFAWSDLEDLPEGVTLEMEVLARGDDGREHRVWNGVIAPLAPDVPARWHPVEVAGGEGEAGDLVLRAKRSGDAGAPVRARWGNPRLSYRERIPRRDEAPPRNVILFLSDTLRADHLGAYGYPVETTPHLDRLAEQGVTHANVQAAASWTKPSVASLFTSRYPSQHGAEDYQSRMRSSEVTLAEVFDDAGYRTAAIGVNYFVFHPEFNLAQGFQDFIEVMDLERTELARAEAVVDEAVDWIVRHRADPFLLYLHVIDPHAPYDPGPAERARFVPESYAGPFDGTVEGPKSFDHRPPEEVTGEDLQFLRSMYDAEIAAVDREIGRLVACLEMLGLWEETTFVFTADHGEEFLDHDGWLHGRGVFQEQLNVPLIIKPPRSAEISPRRVERPVSLIDVAPTLCRFAGIPLAGVPFGGQDLNSLYSAPDRWEERPLLSELNRQQDDILSIRRGNLKYVSMISPRVEEAVYRLDVDPGERENVLATLGAGWRQSFRELRDAVRDSRPRAGLYVEFLGDGAPTEVGVELLLSDANSEFTLFDEELYETEDTFHSQARDPPPGVMIGARFQMGGVDRRDGMVLWGAATDVSSLTVWQDGEWMSPERILVGPDSTSPPRGKFPLARDVGLLPVESVPPWDERPGTWCRIWRVPEFAVEIDDHALERLRHLGYIGEDG